MIKSSSPPFSLSSWPLLPSSHYVILPGIYLLKLCLILHTPTEPPYFGTRPRTDEITSENSDFLPRISFSFSFRVCRPVVVLFDLLPSLTYVLVPIEYVPLLPALRLSLVYVPPYYVLYFALQITSSLSHASDRSFWSPPELMFVRNSLIVNCRNSPGFSGPVHLFNKSHLQNNLGSYMSVPARTPVVSLLALSRGRPARPFCSLGGCCPCSFSSTRYDELYPGQSP